MAQEIWFQSQVESYQRLKKWYLMPPCLTLSIIRYGSRVKWSNPEKGVAPSPTPWCSSYRVTLDYGRQLYFRYNLCFTYKEDNFIWVTRLRDRRLTFPNITTQLNQCREKICQHSLWGEDSVKLICMAELLSRNGCWGSKIMSKGSSGQRCANTGY